MPVINLPVDSGLKELKDEVSSLKVELTKQHVELMDTQTQILQQLKILNTYLAMMNNTIIREE